MTQSGSIGIVPDKQELGRIERDLRFHPASTQAPKVLTREQIEQFNRQGFLRGLRVFSDAEADANRRYFDALLAQVLASGGDSYSIITAHLKYGTVYDLLTAARR